MIGVVITLVTVILVEAALFAVLADMYEGHIAEKIIEQLDEEGKLKR